MDYNKFGKIPSLRNLIKEPFIKNLAPGHTSKKFHGQVKLHGTHGAIAITEDDQINVFSRNRQLSLQSDNNGFAAWVNSHKQYFLDNWWQQGVTVWLYGEWIGPGIQKGVAINKLEHKQFVLFGMYYDFGEDHPDNRHEPAIEIPETWGANSIGMYSIKSAPINWILEIDLNKPNKSIEQIDKWVKKVEQECPWGDLFDIKGTGEGIVFTNWDDPKFPIRFKAKGEKHQATSEKKVKAIDPIVASASSQFVDAVLTESRLNQGLEYLKEMNLVDTMENTGTYIKWVINDVLTEESNLLEELNLEWDQVKKTLNKKTVAWYKLPR